MTRRAHPTARLRPASGALIGALITGLATNAAVAQQAGPTITGHASLGMRNVSVDGSTNKFREDINLDDGVRLLDAAFSYVAAPDSDSPVDRIDFDASHLGGDPFETIHFGARKFGVYNLKLDRRRSQYFYDDIILPPALASIDGSTGGDFHTFDFERVRDRAALEINITPLTKFTLAMDRHRRTGDSTTVFDIQRDEFDLDRPIDESMNAANIGIQHSWDKVTLVFERDAREFENSYEAFLPGASSGINEADPADLLFYSLDQSYDYESAGNTLRVIARPTQRLDLRAFWRLEDLDLSMDAEERSAGTTFTGAPFTTDVGGFADIGRDIEVQQFGFGYLLGERVRLTGELRRHTLDQRGAVVFDAAPGSGIWDIETIGTEFGFEYAISDSILFSAGISQESRDAQHADAPVETDRNGFYATVSLRPGNGLSLEASIEDDDIDDAYTLTSPTGARRYRLQARYRWDNGIALNASLRHDELDNDLSGWDADTDQANLNLAYASERLSVTLGYTAIDLGRAITQTVTAGFRTDVFDIAYDADIELLDGSVRWQLNDRISLGSRYAQYDNDGSFPLKRDEYRAFIEVDVGSNYLVRTAWRDIEYREDGFDDYDTELVELAFDVRW